MKPNDPRRIYLLETLGLSHDPFAGPVAEQELHRSERDPHFFDYYTDPQEPKSNKLLPQVLREARGAFIFGQPGSGKTTLRYTLEAECRAVRDGTLVVTYELSSKMDQLPAAQEHWASLAAELAIDLFIQVIEQFNTLPAPTDVQKQHLQTQMALVWPRLRRTVYLILEDDFSDRNHGLASLWPRLNRPATRYIAPSPKIINLIKSCIPPETDILRREVEKTSAESQLEAGLAAANVWGFKQIFVLVDGLDAHERKEENMLGLIAPLLENLTRWRAKDMFFYFFLTHEMQPVLKDYEEKRPDLPLNFHTIKWDETTLAELLHQRLWAAGSRVPGFNALAASSLGNKLEDYLVRTAHDSPRRLLRLVSALIDAHAQNEPDQPLITVEDWRNMRKNWSYGPPLPPDLATNGVLPTSG